MGVDGVKRGGTGRGRVRSDKDDCQFRAIAKRERQRTYVKDLVLLDESVHSANSLFHRCTVIRSVKEADIDVVHLETFEGRLETFDNVLSRVTLLVGIGFAGTEEDLS